MERARPCQAATFTSPRARDGVPLTTLTCATMLVMSPVLAGSRRVLDSFASLEKALTYCSATEREAAALPCWGREGRGSAASHVPPRASCVPLSPARPGW